MEFSESLISWYKNNKRDLPWRVSKEPYSVWLSEIILQQTRVDQGKSYYLKFISHYPKVEDLANAMEDEVLKLWQGLGYYSRARNLHYTAKDITENYGGEFPDNFKDLQKLKGVGKYTAAAIASICFNESVPVVDGNVFRVLSRVFGIETPIDSSRAFKEYFETAQELIDAEKSGVFNQAMMEFGAIHCIPKNPQCEGCIYMHSCAALEKNMVTELPKKSKKIKQRDRFFNYLVIEFGDHVYLNKRASKDIWANLYDFPLIESEKEIAEQDLINSKEFADLFQSQQLEIRGVSEKFRHILSHQKINTRFWRIKIQHQINTTKYIKVNKEELDAFPVPKLIENYLTNSFQV